MRGEVSPLEAQSTVAEGKGVLIDVRTPAEFQEVHASSAVNIPLNTLSRESIAKVIGNAEPIFICKSGARGKQALDRATSWDLPAANIVGGTMGWEASGCSVVRGTPAVMSLERQVRIAAGLLVVVGTALGLFVSPWAFGIPLFVGSGLVFAGVTDTCGMAMLLARMPWNQRKGVSI
jgi:rhodanese-related sulfurtransferase